jgi:hypothetical protein
MSRRPRDASQNLTLPVCFETGSYETTTETIPPLFVVAKAGREGLSLGVSITVVFETLSRHSLALFHGPGRALRLRLSVLKALRMDLHGREILVAKKLLTVQVSVFCRRR